jgi:hypothetical protein
VSFFFIFLPPMKKRDRSQSIRPKTDQHQRRGQIYSHKPFAVVGYNHDKMEKWPEKIIPQRRHHLCLDVAVRKPKSPCRSSKKVVDVDAATTFIGAAMEKTNSPYLFTVAG